MVEYIVLSIGAMRRSAAKGGADPATVQQMGEAGAALLAAFEHNLTSKSEEQMPIRAVMMDAPVSVVPMFRGQMARRTDSFIEVTEAFLEGSVPPAKMEQTRLAQERSPQTTVSASPSDLGSHGASDDVRVGAYVFALSEPLRRAVPRWHEGSPTRRKPVLTTPKQSAKKSIPSRRAT